MKTITDTKILDNIIDQLVNGEDEGYGKVCANYEDEDTGIYIDASVVWDIRGEENWITIDGRRYYEGTYYTVYGWDDLEVDAWIGEERAEVDLDYIEKNLYK